MSKLNKTPIVFVNPDTDFFEQGLAFPEYLEKNFPSEAYDIIHIHFSFNLLPLSQFKKLLDYFKSIKKPIVWTVHSLKPQRIRNLEKGKYEKLLFRYADKLITLTVGAKNWIENNWGRPHLPIEVIPAGYIADPDEVRRLRRTCRKDKNLFTYLIGDFRENKEYIQSIINFLQCSSLKKAKLQLIFKPINLYEDKQYCKLKNQLLNFYQIVSNNRRIRIISKPEISNKEITRAFLKSHAIILPYKWGTHSGQIELAKDCGCHVVVSDVGFYQEQWDKITIYKVSDNEIREIPKRFTQALIEVYQKAPLKPIGSIRKLELKNIINRHINIYQQLICKKKK
ncbi:MAG: glycosyltransferase [Minisyncoccia bacterium]